MNRSNCIIFISDILIYFKILDFGIIPREISHFYVPSSNRIIFVVSLGARDGTVHVPKSAKASHFSHIYLIRGLCIFLLISIRSKYF